MEKMHRFLVNCAFFSFLSLHLLQPLLWGAGPERPAAGRPSLRPPDGAARAPGRVCAAAAPGLSLSPRNEEDLDVEAPDFKWQKGNLIGKGAVGSVYLGIVHGAQRGRERATRRAHLIWR